MKIARLPDGSPEIFHSLQGEGVSAGEPAVFIRASTCNLHCLWCDTDYTWNWVGTPWEHAPAPNHPPSAKYRMEDQLVEMTPADVAAAVSDFPCRRLVATGGEPLAQQEEFLDVFEILRDRDPAWTIEVETNGTILPSPDFDSLIAQYNVSPKLANSNNPENLRLRRDPLAFFAASNKAWFKFVITNDSDLDEILALQSAHSLDPKRILLMPEARDRQSLAANRPRVADLCASRGFRFSDRLHLELWDARRGR